MERDPRQSGTNPRLIPAITPGGPTRLRPAAASFRKAQIARELDRLELLLEQIKIVEAERDVLIVEQTMSAPAPRRSCLHQGNLVRSFRQSFTLKACFGTSTTGVRLPPMRGWRRHHGIAARLIVSRASQKRVIHGCDDDGRACMAMAALPAGFDALALV
jgi:hypothetical protein